jgi:hypothetical protein
MLHLPKAKTPKHHQKDEAQRNLGERSGRIAVTKQSAGIFAENITPCFVSRFVFV